MTHPLPPSLAARPNIPYEQQTLDQLRAERDYWDAEIADMNGWGAALTAANEFRRACDHWIRIREAEQKGAGQ